MAVMLRRTTLQIPIYSKGNRARLAGSMHQRARPHRLDRRHLADIRPRRYRTSGHAEGYDLEAKAMGITYWLAGVGSVGSVSLADYEWHEEPLRKAATGSSLEMPARSRQLRQLYRWRLCQFEHGWAAGQRKYLQEHGQGLVG